MEETSPISLQSNVNDPFNTRVNTVGRSQPHCELKIGNDDGLTSTVGETSEF